MDHLLKLVCANESMCLKHHQTTICASWKIFVRVCRFIVIQSQYVFASDLIFLSQRLLTSLLQSIAVGTVPRAPLLHSTADNTVLFHG